jgi:predicted nicotinamide N-methyase
LHQATPASGLGRLVGQGGSPYWAYCWAGGLALARHILDHPYDVAERAVLDLGAGSGLVAIAAAKAGASRVIAAETNLFGVAALTLNAAANGVAVSVISHDLLDGPPLPAVDLVLVGDLFYEHELAMRVTPFLDRCVSDGIRVLVGDPWREPLPLERLRLLATYPVPDFGIAANAPLATSGVFSYGN